jgi:hypothetical protein
LTYSPALQLGRRAQPWSCLRRRWADPT